MFLSGALLFGCGGGDTSVVANGDAAGSGAAAEGESAAQDDSAEQSGSAESNDGSATDDAAERDPSVGPLEAVLGFGGDPEEMQADQMEQMRKAEESIAACMRAEGFEYTPFVPDTSSNDFAAFDFDETDREAVAERGFGMSTSFGDSFGAGLGSDSMPEDPNQTYVQSLTEAEREAYFTTLHGDMPDPTEVSDVDGEEGSNMMFEPSGCQGEAFEEQFAQFAILEEYEDDFEAMGERFYADPRIVEMNKSWTVCMREAGHEFTDQDKMYEAVSSRMDELFGSPMEMSMDEELTEEEFNALTDAEKEAMFAMPAIDEEKLAEIQTYEKSVALANFDCDDGNAEARMEVQHEYEQLFLDENPDILTKTGS